MVEYHQGRLLTESCCVLAAGSKLSIQKSVRGYDMMQKRRAKLWGWKNTERVLYSTTLLIVCLMNCLIVFLYCVSVECEVDLREWGVYCRCFLCGLAVAAHLTLDSTGQWVSGAGQHCRGSLTHIKSVTLPELWLQLSLEILPIHSPELSRRICPVQPICPSITAY